MRHQISIVEQVDIQIGGQYGGTDEVAIWESSNFRFLPNYKSFGTYLEAHYPDYEWLLDDGDDWDEAPRTDYCQYVTYLNKNKTHCLLATYGTTTKE